MNFFSKFFFRIEFLDCPIVVEIRLRQKLNDLTSPKTKDPKQQKSSGLTITDFVAKAAALACKKRPETNSIWMENSIRQ